MLRVNQLTGFGAGGAGGAEAQGIDRLAKAMLHFEGTVGGTTFTDSSEALRNWTGGAGAQIGANFKFGSTGLIVNSSLVNHQIYVADHNDFVFGNGDFTIDCWIYPFDVTANQSLFYRVGTSAFFSWDIGVGTWSDGVAGSICYTCRAEDATQYARYVTTSPVLSTNVWQHIALERQGTVLRIYVNGTSVPLNAIVPVGTNYTYPFGVGAWAYIGSYSTGGAGFNGYIDEYRISKGIARYGGVSFTPPAAPYTTVIPTRKSSYLSRYNRGTFPTRTNRTNGTFAIWIKRTAIGTAQVLLGGYDGGSDYATYLMILASNTLAIQFGGAAAYTSPTVATITDTTWHHLCFAWDTTQATAANRIMIYIDGVLQTLSTPSLPPQNAMDQQCQNSGNNRIGADYTGTSNATTFAKFSDIYFIDGQTLTPAAFTSGTGAGTIHPTIYAGTYGACGYHLDFANGDGTDSSGNNLPWGVWDYPTFSLTDIPT